MHTTKKNNKKHKTLYLVYDYEEEYNRSRSDESYEHKNLLAICDNKSHAYKIGNEHYIKDILFADEDSDDSSDKSDDSSGITRKPNKKFYEQLLKLDGKEKFDMLHKYCVERQARINKDRKHCIVIDTCSIRRNGLVEGWECGLSSV